MKSKDAPTKTATTAASVIIVLAALIAGAPTLRGGFLSGDDVQLVLEHVYVNHPSWDHAWKIITLPVHRDLYQPIPMLSFALDFAIIDALKLTGPTHDINNAAWLFHLTNILIHAANSLLAYFLMKRLITSNLAACLAALLFAVHPISAEPIAWINGRMILLSTMFSLAALITFDRFSNRPTIPRAAVTILLVIATMTSKVNPALPFLMLIVSVARYFNRMITQQVLDGEGSIAPCGRRLNILKFATLWTTTLLITIAFSLYALKTTADSQMFQNAAAQLPASRPILTVLALGTYLQNIFLPINLAPWYPPPLIATWTDPQTIKSLTITCAFLGTIFIWTIFRHRKTEAGATGTRFPSPAGTSFPSPDGTRFPSHAGTRFPSHAGTRFPSHAGTRFPSHAGTRFPSRSPSSRESLPALQHTLIPILAIAWFLIAITPTLPLFTTRRSIGADRYLYLPAIGIYWLIAATVTALYHQAKARALQPTKTRIVATALTALIAITLIAAHWHFSRFFHSNIAKAERIAALNPNYPGVWQVLGWAHYRKGQYDAAISAAKKDLNATDPNSSENPATEAWQCIAMAYHKKGDEQQALAAIKNAITADPNNSLAQYRLGLIRQNQNRLNEAESAYRKALEFNPDSNIALLALGKMLRNQNRPEQAIPILEKLIKINPWDVEANMELAGIDIARQQYAAAANRLEALLDWMPENADAWTNLGVAYFNQRNLQAAINAYTNALKHNPQHPYAARNLKFIHDALHQTQPQPKP
jgi:tetratricopeptide (TPR) repeat protein